MHRTFTLVLASCFALLSLSNTLFAQAVVFDAAAARHLLARTTFGPSAAEVEAAVAAGLNASVDKLLAGATARKPRSFEVKPIRVERAALRGLSEEERQKKQNENRREDLQQLRSFTAWWMEVMVGGDAPLREKLVLFWHGHFTSSMRDVRDSKRMIDQNELLREECAGSFRRMLKAITVDAAMLEYLDNDENRAGKPNENYAREVMELFTLGVGNYTEKDIAEAARALTGWRVRGDEVYLDRRQQDRGEKTVLGVTARIDTDELLEILLARPEATRWVAARLVRFFAGENAAPELAASVAAALRENDWQLAPALRVLFTHPGFYARELRGQRVLSPVELVASLTHRTGDVVPPFLLVAAASRMGQTLFDPPDVRGWGGGADWINSASLLERQNWCGHLVGGVNPRDLKGGGDDRALRELARSGNWTPKKPLLTQEEQAGITTERALVDHLCRRFLEVQPLEAVRATLAERVKAEFVGGRCPADKVVRGLLKLVLSLPEAQIH